MTNLERMMIPHVEAATTTTIAQATERIAEEMARELLRDPIFRAEMSSIIRTHFSNTLRTLTQPKPSRRRKA